MTDGSVAWSWAAETDISRIDSLVVSHNLLFISAVEQGTIALDLATQQPVWQLALGGQLAFNEFGQLLISDLNTTVALDLAVGNNDELN